MDTRIRQAEQLMRGFRARTGIDGGAPPERYLWTDAYAVCNLLLLHRLTGNADHLQSAMRLAEQVHRVLGQYRPDDESRRGWLSGLSDDQAALHPTAGGLRIGKPLPERPAGESMDPHLEWERDGQYFHYLTRWMEALLSASAATGEQRYALWAGELALASHRAFVYEPQPGLKRMYWKMSIDLSRPLVMAMGATDALDGLVVFSRIASALGAEAPQGGPLRAAIADMRRMCADTEWKTADPLGIGGLLSAAASLMRLAAAHDSPDAGLLDGLLSDALASLHHFALQDPLSHSPRRRLAFRELGLAIGLRTLDDARSAVDDSRRDFSHVHSAGVVQRIVEFKPLADRIDSFWSAAENQRSPSWIDHENINAVMLATSLLASAASRTGPTGRGVQHAC